MRQQRSRNRPFRRSFPYPEPSASRLSLPGSQTSEGQQKSAPPPGDGRQARKEFGPAYPLVPGLLPGAGGAVGPAEASGPS